MLSFRNFLLLAFLACPLAGQTKFKPQIPKVWDDAAMAEWATPVAGLNLSPKHISSREYYALKPENLRTYPVYAPGREPEGYWKRLQDIGPQPSIEPGALKSEADWIDADRRVFDELDFIHLRTANPEHINEVRIGSEAPSRVLPGGSLFGMRWVPTKQGVELAFSNCNFCHVMFLPDGTRVPGAPFHTIAPRPPATFRVWPLVS